MYQSMQGFIRGAGFLVCAVACAEPGDEPETAGRQLLDRAIAYHDPHGQWATFSAVLQLDEIRPSGVRREAEVTLDRPSGRFVYDARIANDHVVKAVEGDACSYAVNGTADVTDEARTEFRLSCEEILRSRNYYLYLWGLPMKLRDEGTLLGDDVDEVEFQGQPVLSLRVTYDETVGSDTWYFYFAPETARLVGYRFYHDESQNDGEYITLEGEYRLGEMRIPQTRNWYRNDNGELLGTDVLTGHRVSPS